MPGADGSAFCAVEDEHKLRAMGFMDSKQLTEAKRDALWEALQKSGFIGWKIRSLEAKEISEGMLRKHSKCRSPPTCLAPPAAPADAATAAARRIAGTT